MSRAPRSLVAAIDQGTTSSRCILFDHDGRAVAGHQLEHRQITPRPGWVEHDAEEILDAVRACIRGALTQAGADARALAAVGISNQRETTVVWSRSTGRPIADAIVWQDTRTAEACARLARVDAKTGATGDAAGADASTGIDRFRAKTGLPISTYSSSRLEPSAAVFPGAVSETARPSAFVMSRILRIEPGSVDPATLDEVRACQVISTVV